jgi:hypothetical protein
MERREFLKRAGMGSAAIASAPALETLLASPAAANDDVDGNRFFFQVVSKSTTTTDLMIISGCGRITASEVMGRGAFNHIAPAATTPFPIVATGFWRAKELLHFTQIGTYGTLIAGIAEWTAVLRVVSPTPAKVPVTMEVVCNIGPAGLVNPGEEEGVMVTGGPQTFVQQVPAVGLTIFTAPF